MVRFTLMHSADTFFQSNLHTLKIYIIYQLLHSLAIEFIGLTVVRVFESCKAIYAKQLGLYY